MDIYSIWQKISYIIVHRTTLWLLIVMLGTALASWILNITLLKHNAREREAKLAYNSAIGYALLALFLWLFSSIMG